MNDNVAIKVDNISKKYMLFDSPFDRMKESFNPFRKVYHRDFYAVKNVSFDIKKGETVGVIGKNGSGKSTLLKIITGVLSPTEGNVQINGKISALLELGAGFNPEFSGLENVYFNGSIMGYSREQMELKMEEIIAFADIGTYIHQPVKTYSSGMFARLAFAVAINVDPDILIVDEALAVGDGRFVRKCYEKFDVFREQGKTIILVSHDIGTIKKICDRVFVFNEGSNVFSGNAFESCLFYNKLLFPEETMIVAEQNCFINNNEEENLYSEQNVYYINAADHEQYWGLGGGIVKYLKIFGLKHPNIFIGGETIEIEVCCCWNQDFIRKKIEENHLNENIIVGISFQNIKNIEITAFNTFELGYLIEPYLNNEVAVRFRVQIPVLRNGEYFISPAIAVGNQENFVFLRWSEILATLVCVPLKKYVFGLMSFDSDVVSINKIR